MALYAGSRRPRQRLRHHGGHGRGPGATPISPVSPSQLVCGPLADAFGRRPITILFLALYGLGGLAILFANRPVLVARLLQGISAAVGISVSAPWSRASTAGIGASRNAIGANASIGPAIADAQRRGAVDRGWRGDLRGDGGDRGGRRRRRGADLHPGRPTRA